MSLFLRISKLSWLSRITLILFVIVVTNAVMVSNTGYSLLGGDLFTFFFIGFLILLLATRIRPLIQKLVWRVRNRLLVTYFLIGVVPVVLVVSFLFVAFYYVLGQTATYLLHGEIDRRLELLYNSAERLAQDGSAGRERTPPSWSTPGFKGIVRRSNGDHFLAAHAAAGNGGNRTEVFAYQTFDSKTLTELLPGVAAITVMSGIDLQVQVGRLNNPHAVVEMDSEDVAPAPRPQGFWDVSLESPTPFEVRSLETGARSSEFFLLSTRPSLILTKLFGKLGTGANVLSAVLVVIGISFVLVLAFGILFSVRLSQTLTRSVRDLHLGTKKVESGDFSHRIPVRTKDQLSELAGSFNSMTVRVEQLIVEVKEKEKLQAELEIARQVQAQLFPKEVPKLKTLELFGMCNPARVVSGDYYDFIPLDARSTAVVIGDISGKGISAALLMASLQASLHAQLTMGASGGISTATLVGQLNRQLYANTPPEKYATFYCAVYDDDNSRLLYTNAGHLAPILVRGDEIIRLESNGMVVGMFPEFPYEESVVDLEKGDLFAAFTDGITESENAQGEQFGEERLTRLLLRYRERPLDEIVRLITDEVRNWASDLDNQDDTTILLARRL